MGEEKKGETNPYGKSRLTALISAVKRIWHCLEDFPLNIKSAFCHTLVEKI